MVQDLHRLRVLRVLVPDVPVADPAEDASCGAASCGESPAARSRESPHRTAGPCRRPGRAHRASCPLRGHPGRSHWDRAGHTGPSAARPNPYPPRARRALGERTASPCDRGLRLAGPGAGGPQLLIALPQVLQNLGIGQAVFLLAHRSLRGKVAVVGVGELRVRREGAGGLFQTLHVRGIGPEGVLADHVEVFRALFEKGQAALVLHEHVVADREPAGVPHVDPGEAVVRDDVIRDDVIGPAESGDPAAVAHDQVVGDGPLAGLIAEIDAAIGVLDQQVVFDGGGCRPCSVPRGISSR